MGPFSGDYGTSLDNTCTCITTYLVQYKSCQPTRAFQCVPPAPSGQSTSTLLVLCATRREHKLTSWLMHVHSLCNYGHVRCHDDMTEVCTWVTEQNVTRIQVPATKEKTSINTWQVHWTAHDRYTDGLVFILSKGSLATLSFQVTGKGCIISSPTHVCAYHCVKAIN